MHMPHFEVPHFWRNSFAWILLGERVFALNSKSGKLEFGACRCPQLQWVLEIGTTLVSQPVPLDSFGLQMM